MVAKGMKRGRAYLYHFLNILWTSLISVNRKKNVQNAVSYTHLTLPTIA